MKKAELFREYGSYHTDSRNRVCHMVGIPMIVLALLGLLSLVHTGPWNLALFFAVAVLVYYAVLDIAGAALSAVIFALLYVAGTHLQWPVNAALFVVGWVFQLVGHKYEGNQPKFLSNLVYLLIGPLYIFEEALAGVRQSRRAL